MSEHLNGAIALDLTDDRGGPIRQAYCRDMAQVRRHNAESGYLSRNVGSVRRYVAAEVRVVRDFVMYG
jgi:hypothetical protein